MKEIFNYLDDKYNDVPLNDFEAYQYYYNYNDVYNKLLLSQLQNLECAPVGIKPTIFPIIIKPIINLYGMSNGYCKIDTLEEYNNLFKNFTNYIGMFWQKYLDGQQYNIDLNMKDGKIIQYFCVNSEPDINGMFKYHYYNKKYRLPKKVKMFIEQMLENYTGFVNIEVINNIIIEMHLRLNGDLFLYSKKNIDTMMKRKKTRIKNKCFFPIFTNKNINIIDYLNSLNINYELDTSICNDYKRYCHFTFDDINKGMEIQKKIYNFIYNVR